MASFVEYATLKLNERSAITSIRKVNVELKKLDRTAKSLARSLASVPSIGGKLAGGRSLSNTSRQLDRINRQLRQMQSLKFRTTGLNQTMSELQRLSALLTQIRRQAARPFNIRLNANPAGVPSTRPQQTVRRNGATFGTGTTQGGINRGLVSAFGGINIREIVAYGAVVTIASGVIEGTRGRAQEEARFENLQLRPGERAALERERQRVSLEGALTGTEAGKLVAELFPTSQFQTATAGAMASALEPMFNNLLATTQNRDRAFDELSQVMRGIEQRGNIYDAAGNLDIQALQRAVRVEEQVQSVLGENYSAAFQRRLSKMLGAAKFGLSDEAFIMLSLMGEESGTRAAVGFNQVQKQLFRPTSDARREAQFALGIRDVKGVKEAELLQSNLPRWIQSVLVPAARKAGIPLDTVPDFQNLAGSIIGDVRGQESLVAFLSRSPELFKTVERSMENLEKGIRPDNARNAFVVWSNVVSQFTSTLGEIGKVLTDDLRGPLEAITRGLAIFEETIRTMNPSWRKTGEAVVALGGAAIGIKTFGRTLALLTGATNLQTAATTRATVATNLFGASLGKTMLALAGLPFALAALRDIAMGGTALNEGEQEQIRNIERNLGVDYEAFTQQRRLQQQIESGTAPRPVSRAAGREAASVRGIQESSPINQMKLDTNTELYIAQTERLGGIVARAGQTLSAAEVAALSAGQRASTDITQAGETTATKLEDGFSKGTQEMRDAGIEMGRNAADILIQAGPSLGADIAAYLEEAIVRGAARARFQWPGGPRTNVNTIADLGYSGSGDTGGNSAATTAIGAWG